MDTLPKSARALNRGESVVSQARPPSPARELDAITDEQVAAAAVEMVTATESPVVEPERCSACGAAWAFQCAECLGVGCTKHYCTVHWDHAEHVFPGEAMPRMYVGPALKEIFARASGVLLRAIKDAEQRVNCAEFFELLEGQVRAELQARQASAVEQMTAAARAGKADSHVFAVHAGALAGLLDGFLRKGEG